MVVTTQRVMSCLGTLLHIIQPLMLMSQMGATTTDGASNPFAGGNMMQTMMLAQMLKKMGGMGNGSSGSGNSKSMFKPNKGGFFDN